MLKNIKVGEIKKLSDHYHSYETITLLKDLPRLNDIPLRFQIPEDSGATGEIVSFEKLPTKILARYEFSMLELAMAVDKMDDKEVLDWLVVE